MSQALGRRRPFRRTALRSQAAILCHQQQRLLSARADPAQSAWTTPRAAARAARSVHTLIDAARYRPLVAGRRSAGFALVDAFAPDLYTGNPAGAFSQTYGSILTVILHIAGTIMAYRVVGAAVVRLAAFDELSPDAMQRIAAELNAPATAFIAPAAETVS